MIAQLKAELRKLLTVRSTYILLTVAFLLVGLSTYLGVSSQRYDVGTCATTGEVLYDINHYDERLNTQTPEEICGGDVKYTTMEDKNLSQNSLLLSIQSSLQISITFVTIILILLIAHEYRHNTINYTITISNSRSKILAAKLVVGVAFTLLVALLTIGLTMAAEYSAIAIKDLVLPPNDFNWLYLIGRQLVYVVGYALFFMGTAFLVRNLVGAVALAFVLPTINSIAAGLMHLREMEPTKWLPFSALERFGNSAADLPGVNIDFGEPFATANPQATVLGALAVFSVYLVVLWAITWYLFLRRDAN